MVLLLSEAVLSIESIFIPASVTSFGEAGNTHYIVAGNCPKLKEFVVATSNQIYCSKDGVLFSKNMEYLYCCPQGKSGKYIVPDTVKGFSCAAYTVSNGLSAFAGCTKLTEIVLPEGIGSIGDCLFSGCSSLKSFKLPDNVTRIGAAAFVNCSNLTDITIPTSVVWIGEYAFSSCSSLTDIKLLNRKTRLGGGTFDNCSSLKSATIACDDCSFTNCTSLTNVTFLKGVKEIYGDPFYGCTALETLVIPDTLTKIGGRSTESPYPFHDCKKLSSITVSAGNEDVIDFFASYGFAKALKIYDIPIADCKIGSIADQVYSGKAIKPEVTVKYTYGKLIPGEDYTLSYANNRNVGEASVTITGTGKCIGRKTISFIINPKAVPLSSLKAGKSALIARWKKGSSIDGYEIEYCLKKNFKGAEKITVSGAKATSTVLEGLKAKKTSMFGSGHLKK